MTKSTVGQGAYASIDTDGITAAGTTQGTATACTADHEIVTTATEGQGVILLPGIPGAERSVANQTSVGIVVYPPSGAALNGKSANAGVTLPPNKAALFIFLSATVVSMIAG